MALSNQLCKCGCGNPTKIAKVTRSNRGHVKGLPLTYISGHVFKTIQDHVAHFWSRVNKEGPVHPVLGTRCWLWTGAVSSTGYGSLEFDTTQADAHRVAWYLAYGKWPKKETCHHCDVRLCVNIEHLFSGTRQKNVDDAVAKQRHAHGETHGFSKLTNEKVVEIRNKYATGDFTYKDLGDAYGLERHTIGQMVREETWKHIPKENSL
jgi:HNH endonuclease